MSSVSRASSSVFALSYFIPGMTWFNSLLGILAGGGSLYLVAFLYHLCTREGRNGRGWYIKLLAMMGAFFGWQSVPFIIFVSSLAGSVIGVTVMLIQKKDSKLAIPFGPFLAFGEVIYIFYGRQIVHWYLTFGAASSRKKTPDRSIAIRFPGQ